MSTTATTSPRVTTGRATVLAAVAALLLSACSAASEREPESYVLPCTPTVVHKQWDESGEWQGDARVTSDTSAIAASLALSGRAPATAPTMATADLLVSYSPSISVPRATVLPAGAPYRLLIEAPPRDGLSPYSFAAALAPVTANGCDAEEVTSG